MPFIPSSSNSESSKQKQNLLILIFIYMSHQLHHKCSKLRLGIDLDVKDGNVKKTAKGIFSSETILSIEKGIRD